MILRTGSSAVRTTALALFSLFIGVAVTETLALTGGQITPTGIKVSNGADYQWCDSIRLFVRTGGQVFIVNAATLENSPIKLLDEKGNGLSIPMPEKYACKHGQVLAFRVNDNVDATKDLRPKVVSYYIGTIAGGRAVHLLNATQRMLGANFQAKYILALMPRIKTSDGYSILEKCATDHRPDFKVVCWDTDVRVQRFLTLQRFVVAPYSWNEIVAIRDSLGQAHQLKNQAAPKRDKSANIVRNSVDLRNVQMGLIATLTDDETFKINTYSLAVSPGEERLYAPCVERKESPEGELNFTSICQYPLNGRRNSWERIATFVNKAQLRGHIEGLDMGVNGDGYFMLAGARPPNSGIWKLDSRARKFERVTDSIVYSGDIAPKVDQSGNQVAFVRNGELYILRLEKK